MRLKFLIPKFTLFGVSCVVQLEKAAKLGANVTRASDKRVVRLLGAAW